MNKNLIIGIVGFILIAGGVYFYMNPQQSTQTEQGEKSSQKTAANSPDQESFENGSMSEGYIVELGNNGFSEESIIINQGDRVVWKNISGRKATVDSNPHPIHTSNPELNLGEFEDGEELEFIFSKIGSFSVHNHYDSGQSMTVVVE